MSFAKMMPTRAQSTSAIVDIDEILSVPTTVKVNGKTYRLIPITVRNAASLEQARVAVREIDAGSVQNFDDVCEVYFEFLHLLCEDLTLDDVKALSLVQLHKLFLVAIKHIESEMSGKTLYEQKCEDDEKKKTLNQAQ